LSPEPTACRSDATELSLPKRIHKQISHVDSFAYNEKKKEKKKGYNEKKK